MFLCLSFYKSLQFTVYSLQALTYNLLMSPFVSLSIEKNRPAFLNGRTGR